MRARLVCIRYTIGHRSVSFLQCISTITVIASQCAHWRGNPHPPWLPLWVSCHEVTEKVKIALSAPSRGHLSHGERQGPHPSRLRRATYTLLCNCHWQLLDFDSLRGAPPHGGRLRERIVTGGNPWKGPHQRALHYGMTATGSHCNFNSLRGAPLVRNDSIYRNALQERYRACTQWSVDYRPTGARIARRGSRQKDVPQKCGTPFGKGFGKNRISRRRR